MDSHNSSVPTSSLLIGVLIKNYPKKHAEIVQLFKEYLEKSHHVTKYYRIKANSGGMTENSWHLKHLNKDNVYVFPYSDNFQQVLCKLIWDNYILPEYVIISSFIPDYTEYRRTKGNPVEFHSCLGSIQRNTTNTEFIQDW
jgi:hypothetical protein